MIITTVYTLNGSARRESSQQDLLVELDELAQSLSAEILSEEVVRVHADISAEEKSKLLERFKFEVAPPHSAMQVAMVSVRFSARSVRAATMMMHAHQRLMLRFAHQRGIDLGINT